MRGKHAAARDESIPIPFKAFFHARAFTSDSIREGALYMSDGLLVCEPNLHIGGLRTAAERRCWERHTAAGAVL